MANSIFWFSLASLLMPAALSSPVSAPLPVDKELSCAADACLQYCVKVLVVTHAAALHYVATPPASPCQCTACSPDKTSA